MVALHTPLAWPKGVKTIPEADQEQGGTKPAEWDQDLAELLRRIDAFKPLEGHPHPMFGPHGLAWKPSDNAQYQASSLNPTDGPS
jgi:hypothetical protein